MKAYLHHPELLYVLVSLANPFYEFSVFGVRVRLCRLCFCLGLFSVALSRGHLSPVPSHGHAPATDQLISC